MTNPLMSARPSLPFCYLELTRKMKIGMVIHAYLSGDYYHIGNDCGVGNLWPRNLFISNLLVTMYSLKRTGLSMRK